VIFIIDEYHVFGVVFLVLVFGLIRLMSWADKD
jgi:hypothetical protein